MVLSQARIRLTWDRKCHRIRMEEENALSNLYVRIANAMDVPITGFGDSSGIEMSELFG